MGRTTRGKNQQKSSETPGENEPKDDKEPEKIEETELDWLYALDEGTDLAITRKAPDCAEGYLGMVKLDKGGYDSVLERIRSKWGGGLFHIQPRGRQRNGHRYFAGGSTRVTIAGEPMLDGTGYDEHGRHLPKPMQPTYPTVPGYPQPAPAPAGGAGNVGQGQLLGIVERALSRGEAQVDLAGVITALNGMQRDPVPAAAPVRVNTMSEMKQMMELMALMRAQAGPTPEPVAAPDDPMERMMQIAMMKWMGESGGTPTAQPTSGPPQAPSPQHVWHQQRGWVLLKPAGSPEPAAASKQQATQSAPQPPPSDKAEGRETKPDKDYVEPIKPDELIGELEHRSPEEQQRFIREVMGMVEQRPELAKAFMGVAQSAKDAPAGGDLSVVGTSE